MATIASTPVDHAARERRFYTRMALFLVALVFIGFAPSFYLRGIVPEFPRPNPTLPPAVLLHGSLFTLWMLIFVAQTQLVAAGRRDLHMKLGAAAMLLAPLILASMYLIGVWQVARANQPPFTDSLNWTVVPLGGIPVFAILVWQGWKRRRDAQWHKRLMLGAAIGVVFGPAIGRLPLGPPSLGMFVFQQLLGLAVFAPLIVWDRRTQGRVHPATRLAVLLSAGTIAISAMFLSTGGWAPIAARLPGVGA